MSTPFGRRPLLDELLADSDAALAAVRLSIVALAFLLSICFSNLVGLLLVVGVVVDAIHDNPNLEWDNGYLSNVLPTLLPAPAPWPPVKTFASRNDHGTTSKLWLGAKLGKQDSTYEPIQLETAMFPLRNSLIGCLNLNQIVFAAEVTYFKTDVTDTLGTYIQNTLFRVIICIQDFFEILCRETNGVCESSVTFINHIKRNTIAIDGGISDYNCNRITLSCYQGRVF